MEKQKNYLNSLCKRLCLSTLFSLSMLTGMYAQDFMDNGRFITDGKRYTVPADGQKIQDIVMPPQASGKYLYLELKGADGGTVRRKTAGKFTEGGEGTTVKVYVKIGHEANQIPTGSHFRFIVGEKGSSKATGSTVKFAAGSGGGTGVAFRGPEAGASWQLLAVAGAGSGGVGNCCSTNWPGKPGTGIVTTKIPSFLSTGGTLFDPNHVNVYMHLAGAGGGAFADGANASLDPDGIVHKTIEGGKAGWPGGPDSGAPTGGAGGPNSGWGFGGGGGSRTETAECSGGGGGFVGGFVKNLGGDTGKGGASFYNDAYATYGYAVINNTTPHPNDGHVDYQFIDALPALPPIPSIILASAPEKCIDAEIKLKDVEFENGGNLRLWDCKPNGMTQSWALDGNQIKLVRDESKCMDVKNHETSNGTNVRVWDCMNHNEQKWIYDGLSWQLRSYLNIEKCLNDAYGGRTDNGTNIMLWDCQPGGGSSDRWVVHGARKVADRKKAKYIVPVKASNLAVRSASYKELESNIQLWDKADGNYAEQWYFDGMQIKLRTQQNLCIDLKSSNTSNGNNIQLWKCNGTDAQKWIYDGLTRTIRSAINLNKCMEVATSGGVFEKGKNIQIMDCNGLMRQKFLIIE